MAQPRIAPRAPAACSACYAQYPGRTYVDFGAALEGRLVDPSKPRGGHVDWVIICENCLRAGVKLLPSPEADRVAELEAQLATVEQRVAEYRTYTEALERTIAARPEPATPPAEPRPKTVGKRPERKARYSPQGDQ